MIVADIDQARLVVGIDGEGKSISGNRFGLGNGAARNTSLGSYIIVGQITDKLHLFLCQVPRCAARHKYHSGRSSMDALTGAVRYV